MASKLMNKMEGSTCTVTAGIHSWRAKWWEEQLC